MKIFKAFDKNVGKNRFLRIMKAAVLALFLFTGACFGAKTYSQATLFNFEIKNETVGSVIHYMEENSEFIFFYMNDAFDTNRRVNIQVNDMPVDKVLDQLLEGTDNTYKISDRQITILKKEKEDIAIPVSQQPSTRRITGTVTEITGEPIIGANVVEKGTANGISTDLEGKFTLDISEGATLVISYIGYIAQEIRTNTQNNYSITLQEDTQTLEEVVVVGYGVQKRVSLSGAVSVVSGEDISSKSATDVISAMQGQLPGVTVLRRGGQPGSETDDIRIRGFTSVNSANPLVLIDGVEGNLQRLNSDDIESISVLKDAAAASIYGSRAAAGVILVTTKRGAAQRSKISYNGSFGVNVPGMMPQRVPSWVEQEMTNIARRNATGSPEQSEERTSFKANPNMLALPNGQRWEFNSATNWLRETTKNYTTQQNHSVSASGGSDKVKYFLSSGFFTKNGLLKYGPDDYRRVNLRATIDAEINNYLDISVNVTYEGTLQKTPSVGSETLFSYLYHALGRQPIYLPEEDTHYSTNPWNGDYVLNPIRIMKEGGEIRTNNQNFSGIAKFLIKNVVKGLTLDLNVSRRAGFNALQGDYPFLEATGRDGSRRTGYDINDPQRVQKRRTNSYQDKLEALLRYNLKLSRHNIQILGGASYEQYLSDQITATARNGVSNDFFSLNYYDTSVATNSVMSDAISPWKMASLFGRINYDFAGRYLFETTLRYDGSSRLVPGSRWGLFPSVSAAWRISEEAFFEGFKNIANNFKLRTSWGQLGNTSGLGIYEYIGTVNSGTWWGNPVYWNPDMVSENVGWETVASTNIGLDFGFLRNRLSLIADYYWKKNDGMLSRMNVGNIVGISSLPYENVGILKTWGWEISAQWRDRAGEVSYHVGFSIDDSKNELVSYEGVNTISDGVVTRLEGYPLYTIWGYKTDGLWNSREEYLAYKAANPGYETLDQDARISGGDVRYVAQGNADHRVGSGSGTPDDPGDLVLLGTENPRYLYCINMGLQWRGFDFSMFWQGVGNRKYVLDNRTAFAPYARGSAAQMPWTIHLDLGYWTEDNPNAYYARLMEGLEYNYAVSDRWLQNGAYIRLKNIQLGYTLTMPDKSRQTLRIFVTGNDVWEYTRAKFKAYDPEVRRGVNANYYPFFRTFIAGVNLTF